MNFVFICLREHFSNFFVFLSELIYLTTKYGLL